MATEILRPQNCLTGRIRNSPALFPRREGCNYGNSYSNNRATPNPSPNPRPIQKQHSPPRSEKSDHKRRSPQPEPRRSGSDDGRDGRIGLVMEKVTILRRGSSLDSKIRSAASPKKDVADPAAKQARYSPMMMMTKSDMYAGSAFAVSPEPGSLPLPSFSKKKTLSFNDSATRDIRRLLQLE